MGRVLSGLVLLLKTTCSDQNLYSAVRVALAYFTPYNALGKHFTLGEMLA